MFQEFHVVWSK